MTHRLFTIVSALSLGICLLTCGLRAKSIWTLDGLGWHSRHDDGNGHMVEYAVGFYSMSGIVGADWSRDTSLNSGRFRKTHFFPGGWKRSSSRAYKLFGHYDTHNGFVFRSLDGPNPWSGYESGWEFACPHWVVIIVTAVLPIDWLRAFMRKRRNRRGEFGCGVCGYDLRATPHRCPECGTVPAGRAKA